MRLAPPTCIVMSTGTEILQGLYADANAMEISRLLLAGGFKVIGHQAVPDDRLMSVASLKIALKSCDFVIMTGGLGPTEDDLTRFVVAEVFETTLDNHPRAEKLIRARFEARGIPVPESNLVQAMIPAGAHMLSNYKGTAPGFFFDPAGGRAAFLAMPGPPSEWPPIFEKALLRHMNRVFPSRPVRLVHTIHIAMAPESIVNEALIDLFQADPRLSITILANLGAVRLRLIASGSTSESARMLIDEYRGIIRQRLGDAMIFAEGPPEVPLSEVVVNELATQRATVALAESCTGGMISSALTDHPGSSAVFCEGFTVYSNASKMRLLGVPEGVLTQHGAVSEQCAEAMAVGARNKTGATYALSVTGVAGPAGGTEDKPVGLVYFGLAGPSGITVLKKRFPGDREQIRAWATIQGLDMIRRAVQGFSNS